jgi:hypothetical protein
MNPIDLVQVLDDRAKSQVSYCHPLALNWHHQIVEDSYDLLLQVPLYPQTCQLNWRYRSSG